MIYKYYVLNIEIINFDYIDEDRSEVAGLENLWLGSITRWPAGPMLGVESNYN